MKKKNLYEELIMIDSHDIYLDGDYDEEPLIKEFDTAKKLAKGKRQEKK